MLPHVQEVVKTALFDDLVHDDDVGDLGHASHEHADVWVSQDTLHHDLVLNLMEQVFGDVWVKDFLYRHWRAIAEAGMDG